MQIDTTMPEPNVKFFNVRVLLLIFSTLFPNYSEAAVFWEESFENHLTPNWDTGACGSVSQDGCNGRISTDVAHSGTHSFKGDYTCAGASNGGQCGTFYDRFHPPTSEIWTRVYYRTVGFVYSPIETKHWFHKAYNSMSDVIADHWSSGRSMGLSTERQIPEGPPCKVGDTACIYSENVSSKPLDDDRWYCIETHVKNNTAGQANGVLEMWVDGTQTVRYTGRKLFDSPIPQFEIFRIYVQHGYGKMYYDDLAVGDTRIGCGPGNSIPPSGPASPPPASPTGLKVQ